MFGLNLSEDLFFDLHLILGKIQDQIWVKTFFFLVCLHLILGKNQDQIWVKTSLDLISPNFGDPASIFVPPAKISI